MTTISTENYENFNTSIYTNRMWNVILYTFTLDGSNSNTAFETSTLEKYITETHFGLDSTMRKSWLAFNLYTLWMWIYWNGISSSSAFARIPCLFSPSFSIVAIYMCCECEFVYERERVRVFRLIHKQQWLEIESINSRTARHTQSTEHATVSDGSKVSWRIFNVVKVQFYVYISIDCVCSAYGKQQHELRQHQ